MDDETFDKKEEHEEKQEKEQLENEELWVKVALAWFSILFMASLVFKLIAFEQVDKWQGL